MATPLNMNSITEYFRCPDVLPDFSLAKGCSEQSGYFRFGSDTIGYGRACVDAPAPSADGHLTDLLSSVETDHGQCVLPFDADEVVENLRRERYANPKELHFRFTNAIKAAYYVVRPLLPFALRGYLKSISLNSRKTKLFPRWPVDRTVDKVLENLMLLAMRTSGVEEVPFIWFWPNGHSGCAVMTHDVETEAGVDFCSSLMALNESFGMRASFQMIPEGRYAIPQQLLAEMRCRGFEINVHDWNHDGKLFSTKKRFRQRADKINQAAHALGAKGFRAAALYRNMNWYDAFSFSYDMSVPNAGHLDPQWGGCCTIMPYFVGRILEIPVTTTQDYMLFHQLGEYSIDLWKNEIDLILEGNGLASFIVHPDYIIEKRARAVYIELLQYLSHVGSERNVWIALPGDVDQWWRNRSQMRLVRSGSQWVVEGPGSDEARVAYAISEGQRLTYRIDANDSCYQPL